MRNVGRGHGRLLVDVSDERVRIPITFYLAFYIVFGINLAIY